MFNKIPNCEKILSASREKYQKQYKKNMEFMEIKNGKKYFNLTKFSEIENIFKS